MKKKLFLLTGLFFSMIIYLSCSKVLPGAPDGDEILDGPIEGLTSEQKRMFIRGDVGFNDEVFSEAMGLGPIFVASSCATCHAGDGKGHPFTTLTRFGQSDTTSNQFLHKGGPQLQNRGVVGFQPETIPA